MTAAKAQQDSEPHKDAASTENAQVAKILLIVLVALVLWGVSIFIWGVPGLYLPALALVPVIWVLLVVASSG